MKLNKSKTPSSFNSFRRGVSLVETLVAMLIIAILAGISYPIIVNVISSSHQSECKSNLKQIGMALTSYDAEFGSLPDLSEASTRIVENKNVELIKTEDCLKSQLAKAGYVGESSSVWICKGNTCGCSEQTGSHYQVNNSSHTKPSFLFGMRQYNFLPQATVIFNHGSAKQKSTFSSPLPKSLSDINEPEATWILSDVIPSDAGSFLSFSTFTNPQAATSSSSAKKSSNPPHKKGYNFLLADGSVKHLQ